MYYLKIALRNITIIFSFFITLNSNKIKNTIENLKAI